MIELFCNPKLNLNFKTPLLDFAKPVIGEAVGQFHQSLPNYLPTPLHSLSHLALQLGVESIRVKDESYRFGLNAFKGLGASYAIAKQLAKQINSAKAPLDFKNILARQNEYKNIVFVTATDGNHGRAVAWAAQLFGCKAVVFMPKGSSKERLRAIQNYAAEATITDLNYDDTVLHAKQIAEENNWSLVQDTAWQGYESIPLEIMQGYFTLVSECLQQDKAFWPTHVFLQAGVGSFAAAMLAFMVQQSGKPVPQFIIVEPTGASCLFESMEQNKGKAYKVEGHMPTIMAGLACGEPSTQALEILSNYADAFVKCDDAVTKIGMRLAANPADNDPALVSGESGAVTLGLVHELMKNEKYRGKQTELALDQNSKILLFSTEGDTDPKVYQEIIRT